MRLFPAALMAGFSIPGILSAVEYHVSGTGSDANPGSASLPWRSIQKAADTVTAGDTVLVHSGTYSRTTLKTSGTSAENRITFANFPGDTPVIDATGIVPPAGDTGLLLIENLRHITVRGFELRNYKATNINQIPAGVRISGACTDITISGCNVHGIENVLGDVSNSGNAFGIVVYGTSTTSSTGIVIDGNEVHHLKTGASESLVINGNVTNFQVTNNRVHDNNNIGIDFIGFEDACPDPLKDQARDGVCRGNVVWNITSEGNQAYDGGDYSADGIYCDGATRILIEGNISYSNDIGVELAAERPGKLTSAITLRNNFVYRNRQTGLFLGGYASSGTGGSEGCVITGNTFSDNDTLQWGAGEVQLRYRTSNCVFTGNIFRGGAGGWLVSIPYSAAHNVNNRFDYNLHFAASPKWKWNNAQKTTFADWKTTSAQDAHSLSINPGFVAEGTSPDLHLRLDSPAIDAGDPAFTTATGEKDVDAGKRITGQRVDIGADELAPIDAWRKQNFGVNAMNPVIAGESANPSGDGIRNLVKYKLGLNPNAHSESGLPQPSKTTFANNEYLTLQYSQNVLAEDAACVVEVSENLSTWSPSAVEVSRVRNGDLETVVARSDLPMAGNPKRFMRLRVSRP